MSSRRKLSDKEFDRYTRNILKKPEGVVFDKGAWAALEQQIEQAPTSTSPYKWIIPVVGAAVLILTYVGYDLYQSSNDPAGELLGTDQTVIEQNSTGLIEQRVKKDQNEPAGEDTETFDVSNEPSAGSSPTMSDFESRVLEEEQKVNKRNESTVSDDIQKGKSQAPIVEDPVDFGNSDFFYSKDESRDDNFELLDKRQPSIIYADDGQPSLLLIRLEITEQDQVEEPISEEVLSGMVSRWGVGVTVAPDFSTVRQLQEFTNPGLDGGITIEYFVSDRVSITSGAILTRKIYNTSDLSAYTIPDGFWSGGETPEEILADCRVIDIPINIRYRLIEGRKTSLYASAGISSYLMLNERYDYNYDNDVYAGNQVDALELSNENNHFFGVYNISLGISRRLSRNFSFEAEPFIKNSLGGVGWGQVRLKSTGALFSLKYHLLKN